MRLARLHAEAGEEPMSRYPDGCPGPVTHTVTLYCPSCGYRWQAAAKTDLGMTDLLDESEGECDRCGAEGE